MNYKEVEDFLNANSDIILTTDSDDGRINSQQDERNVIEKINYVLGISKTKSGDRDVYDLHINDGEDLKIVEPNNFSNTVSFLKLARMLNLGGNNFKQIIDSYRLKKQNGEIKLVSDYVIVFLNKKTKKFTITSLTELPIKDIVVNPSNGIQTRIPTQRVERTYDEKFNLVHELFLTYMRKRVLDLAKQWENTING